MTETIKRPVQPYFVLEGNVAAFLAARDHVNVFVYDGGIVPDPHGLITAGHEQQDGPDDRLPRGRRRPRGALLGSSGAWWPTTGRAAGGGSRTAREVSRFDDGPGGRARVKACGSWWSPCS